MNPVGTASASDASHATAEQAIESDLIFLIARSSVVTLSNAARVLNEFNLTVRSYCLLAVASTQSSYSQRELADILQRSQSLIVPVIDELEQRGLVRRAPHPTDRRTNTIVATDEGRATLELASARLEPIRSAGGRLSEDERHALANSLTKLAF